MLFNADADLAGGGEQDRLAVAGVEMAVRGIVDALATRGIRATALAVPDDPREAAAFLTALAPRAVFNQVESLGGDPRREAHFAALLELAGVPYTGSGPRALALCLDKPMARAVLSAAGVPIAAGLACTRADDAASALRFPLIVKPSREDASQGIATGSVVSDARELRDRIDEVVARYRQPALVEEYLDGREFNVALIEAAQPTADPRVLRVAEIDFTGFPPNSPRIVTYAAKWIEDSPEWRGTRSVDAAVDPPLERRIIAAAVGAWRALGLSGYARVDLRSSAAGALAVIDVNSNPDLSPDAGFALTAARSGLPYDELIATILDRARGHAAARP